MHGSFSRIAVCLSLFFALPVTAQAAAIRIEAGGGAYTAGGKTWAADAHFSGGSVVNRGSIGIANTTDDRLYQTERYGLSGYSIPVANDTYMVKLHFAETFDGTVRAGQRVFNVDVEGYPINNIDVFAAAGGRNKAIVKTLSNVTVSDDRLDITFTKLSGAPMINAIEILSEVGTAVDGACGAAHLAPVESKPTKNLCSAGIASAVTGSGPWNWSCAGIAGGKNASCNAPKKTFTSDGRGRVRVSGGTVVTDRGTMLRGASSHVIQTGPGKANDPDYWRAMHNLGMNVMRQSAKTVQVGRTTMQQLPYLDKAVDLAAANNMYIMINTSIKPGGYDLAALKEFWTIVAPRYKNRTHVIYEVTNEPVSGGPNWGAVPQWTDKVLTDLGSVYAIMRKAAPDTHITIFSTPNLAVDKNYAHPNACNEWKALAAKAKGGVDWSKTSLSFHSYVGTKKFGEANLKCLMGSYPLLMTETNYWNHDTAAQTNDKTVHRLFEKLKISWFSLDREGTHLKNEIIPDLKSQGYTWPVEN